MSGGSYNYFCFGEFEFKKDIDILLKIEKRFIELGYPEIAEKIKFLNDYIEKHIDVGNDVFKEYSDLLRSLEWYDSCDIGLSKLTEKIKEYVDKNPIGVKYVWKLVKVEDGQLAPRPNDGEKVR